MAKFNVGDKVRLISDSNDYVPMTIDGYYVDSKAAQEASLFVGISEEDKKKVKCVWRDTNSHPHSEYYSEDSIELITE